VFSEVSKPAPATSETAWDHAASEGGCSKERAAAMEIACRLMALHDHQREALLMMAADWAAQSK